MDPLVIAGLVLTLVFGVIGVYYARRQTKIAEQAQNLIREPVKLNGSRSVDDILARYPQFRPLYDRVLFIDDVDSIDDDDLREKAHELIDFVKSFEKGDFYSKKLAEKLYAPAYSIYSPFTRELTLEERDENERRYSYHMLQYRKQLKEAHSCVWDIVVEMTTYQGWK